MKNIEQFLFMLSEAQIAELITRGENEEIDFKRELNLDSASEKAELIKDIISIANSKVNVGYLLIGIDNNGCITGVSKIEEERIQQIIHSYINPSLSVNCYLTFLNRSSLHIGVIEIKGFEKPYKVLRSIDKLLQNEVFVRHGSVIAKASPEEIYRMYNESRFFHEKFNHVQAADTFLKLKNFQGAITSYSKAIDLLPTSELFLLRARAYISFFNKLEEQWQQRTKNKGIINFLASIPNDEEREKVNRELKEIFRVQTEQRNFAIKDLSDAILLAKSFEIEKQARFDRLKLLSDTTTEEYWDEDLTWLKHHVEGEELAKVLLVEIERIEGDDVLFLEPNEYALSLLDEILKLGYNHVDVYMKRIAAHFGLFNYGLVLKEVEKALALTDEPDKVRYILCMRGWALERMGKFNEFQALAKELTHKYGKKEFAGFFGGIYKIESEILCRCAIDLEYGRLDNREVSKIRKIVHFFKASIQEVEEKYPKIAAIIQKFLDSNS